jgi:allophanate hydrolase subunit 1
LLALPLAIVLAGIVPRGLRTAVFVMGLGVVAGLCVAGGLQARAALLAGTPRTARTIVVAITGLTLGGVAAIGVLTSTVGSLF